jgi:mannan endo-1,4-beta-mannosidase
VSAGETSKALAAANVQIEAGYNSARARFVKEFQNPQPLFATNVQKEDYVRVSPVGRYFVHADGSPFIPIGYNHNPDWPKFIECNPELPRYDPKVTERFFASLHKSGINLIRLMIETPASGYLEDPIGTFRPEHVRWIDHIVTFARQYDIKLMITPWDTFWTSHRWGICPYNGELGGPVVKRIDFIPSMKWWKRRRDA